MAGDASKDRLLTSEIAELQARVQALLKDNHELRQELSKIAGVDLSRFRSGHKVRSVVTKKCPGGQWEPAPKHVRLVCRIFAREGADSS